MAGHSQFKNIMYRKGAQDAKRAKVFTKIIRELTVSAKAGADPDTNPRLRQAIVAARTENMPKDTMERAIKRGAGGEDTSDYVELRYEGYGPGGVAILVEALTDNRNRTASDVRSIFTKYGGALGETNSVSFMFDRVGLIRYQESKIDHDTLFEEALEAGATNVETMDGFHEVESTMEEFSTVRDQLIGRFGDPESASLVWKPQNMIEITEEEKARTLLKFIDALEDNDDVQTVSGNYDIPDNWLE